MKTKYFIITAALALGLSSCQKKFDPESYAPKNPKEKPEPPKEKPAPPKFSNADEVASANLVAYWGFNGDLIEKKSNIACSNSGTTFADGKKGKALQGVLDGYVVSDAPDAVQKLTSFTVSLWENMPLNDKGIVALFDLINTNNFWGNITIFFENGGNASVGKLVARISKNPVRDENTKKNSPIEINDLWGKWNQIAFSYDQTSSKFKVYFNGVVVRQGTVEETEGALAFKDATKIVFGTTQFQTTPSLTSKSSKQSWAGYLVGKLDEVRVYNKALSDEEIKYLQALEAEGK